MIVWVIWAATVLVGIFNGLLIASIIEKTGLERLGATGKLLSYQKREEHR